MMSFRWDSQVSASGSVGLVDDAILFLAILIFAGAYVELVCTIAILLIELERTDIVFIFLKMQTCICSRWTIKYMYGRKHTNKNRYGLLCVQIYVHHRKICGFDLRFDWIATKTGKPTFHGRSTHFKDRKITIAHFFLASFVCISW